MMNDQRVTDRDKRAGRSRTDHAHISLLVTALWTIANPFAHAQPASGPRQPVQTLPTEIRVCDPGRCGTWTWRNGHYQAFWADIHLTSTVTVQSFTPQSVVFLRVNDSNHAQYIYKGAIASDGMSILHGIVQDRANGRTGPFSAYWGDDLKGHPATSAQAGSVTPTGGNSSGGQAPAATNASANLPPAPALVAKPGKGNALRGVWQQDANSRQLYDEPPMKIWIETRGNKSVAIAMETRGYLHAEYPLLIIGGPPGGDSYNVIFLGMTGEGLMNRFKATLKLDAPGHMTIPPGITFTRVDEGGDEHVDCQPGAMPNVSTLKMVTLAWLYVDDGIAPTAACWLRAAAERGSAGGMYGYGDMLMHGKGIPKDPQKGFALIQKSAMLGNFEAALALMQIFRGVDGDGIVPPSHQRALYWSSLAKNIDPAFAHTQKFLPIPVWALNKSTDCNANDLPQGLTKREAFLAGRVAYEARDLKDAVCWFQVSHKMGDVSAAVYLGILYMFGLGVERDPQAAFAYMQSAADAKDANGLVYLAEFYRYGLGTKQDSGKANQLDIVALLKTPDGADAVTRASGHEMGTAEVTQALAAVTQAAGNQINCDSANAARKPGEPLRKCDQAQDLIFGGMPKGKGHLIENPEELLPESFFPGVPPDTAEMEARKMPAGK
jgi:TPR repeat protein